MERLDKVERIYNYIDEEALEFIKKEVLSDEFGTVRHRIGVVEDRLQNIGVQSHGRIIREATDDSEWTYFWISFLDLYFLPNRTLLVAAMTFLAQTQHSLIECSSDNSFSTLLHLYDHSQRMSLSLEPALIQGTLLVLIERRYVLLLSIFYQH